MSFFVSYFPQSPLSTIRVRVENFDPQVNPYPRRGLRVTRHWNHEQHHHDDYQHQHHLHHLPTRTNATTITTTTVTTTTATTTTIKPQPSTRPNASRSQALDKRRPSDWPTQTATAIIDHWCHPSDGSNSHGRYSVIL